MAGSWLVSRYFFLSFFLHAALWICPCPRRQSMVRGGVGSLRCFPAACRVCRGSVTDAHLGRFWRAVLRDRTWAGWVKIDDWRGFSTPRMNGLSYYLRYWNMRFSTALLIGYYISVIRLLGPVFWSVPCQLHPSFRCCRCIIFKTPSCLEMPLHRIFRLVDVYAVCPRSTRVVKSAIG